MAKSTEKNRKIQEGPEEHIYLVLSSPKVINQGAYHNTVSISKLGLKPDWNGSW